MQGCRLVIFATVLAFSLPFAAQADTDYRCLNSCVSGGKPAAICMQSCTYSQTRTGNSIYAAKPPTPLGTSIPTVIGTSGAAANLTPHNVLKPLQPLNDRILLNPPAPPSPTLHEDYHCVAQCLQNKLQYQMCRESCATVTKPDGTILLAPTTLGTTVVPPSITPAINPALQSN